MKPWCAVLMLGFWPVGLTADNLAPGFAADALVHFDRDALLAGWVIGDSPMGTKLMAGAVASAVSDRLDSAILQIDCVRTQDVHALRVILDYWRAGEQTSGDRYALDVFDSAISGRPAAYDLGLGPVSTADIKHSVTRDGPVSPAYFEAMEAFLTPLAQGEATQLRISFLSDSAPGAVFTADFPLYHLREAAVMLQRECPPTP